MSPTPSMINRRTVLATAVATGAGFATRTAPTASAVPTSPRASSARLVLAIAGRPGAIESPGFPVHHFGATWTGNEQAGRIRLHYADGWHDWKPLRATDSGESDRQQSLAYVGPASAYEVEPAAGICDLRLHAINTVDGPSIEAPRDRVRRWSGLPYLSRAGWGADESLRFEADGTEKFPTAFFDVQTLTVHHTVTANTDPDPAATVRAIYFFHCITSDSATSATTC